MKRNIVIATVAAAALIGGGTATALAVTGDNEAPERQASVRQDVTGADRGDDSVAAVKSAEVTAADAIAAALRQVPGTAVSAELDDDKSAVVWDVDVLDPNDVWHSVRVHPSTGMVLGAHVEREDDTAEVRAALKGTSTTAAEAARAAAAKGTVTSVDLDDEVRGTAWETETRTSTGGERNWHVSLTTGTVTATQPADD